MRYLLGIDAGTSIVKVALFDENGREVGKCMRRTQIEMPHTGWMEADMSLYWQFTVEALRELLNSHRDEVAAIGVTANMVGCWPIDAQGQPVRKAILWNDGRTQSMLDAWEAQEPGFLHRIFAKSGSVMQPGCTLPVIRWLADHEPAILEQTFAVLNCKDWLIYQLTGAISNDPTQASVFPGSAQERDYDPALMAQLGVEQFRHLLPEVYPSGVVVGTVHERAAAVTGLAAGVPVIAGAGDVPATASGAGAVSAGMACTLLGTSCMNCLVVAEPTSQPDDIGLLFCMPDQHWLRAMVTIAGTTNLDWFVAQFGGLETQAAASKGALFEMLEALAKTSPVGSRGVIYHPYLTPVGVIAPFVNPAARANFFGVSAEHTRADFLRAVYEGVALSIRDCYEAIPAPITQIRLSGGGAQSRFWGQLIADCTGKQVQVPEGSEFGARGMAMLAGVSIGWYASFEEAIQTTDHIAYTYDPSHAARQVYDDVYERYVRVRTALTAAW